MKLRIISELKFNINIPLQIAVAVILAVSFMEVKVPCGTVGVYSCTLSHALEEELLTQLHTYKYE